MKTRNSAPNRIASTKDKLHLQKIIAETTAKYRTNEHEIFNKLRLRNISKARHEICYRAWEETDLTCLFISAALEMHPTSVRYGARQHEKRSKPRIF